MGEVLALIATAEIWQLGLIAILVVASSTTVSAFIGSGFGRWQHNDSFRRAAGGKCLVAIAAAHTAFVRYGNRSEHPLDDRERDDEVAALTAAAIAAAGGIGKTRLLAEVQAYLQLGALFATGNEDTGAEDFDIAYKKVIKKLTRGVPR